MPYDIEFPKTPEEILPSPFLPNLALLFYSRAQDGQTQFLMRKHDTLPAGSGWTLGPAQTLTPLDTQHLAAMLVGTGLQLTRETTLAVGNQSVAWWRPPGPAAMLFDAKYKQTKSIARLSGVPVPLPGLVFIALPGSLQIYAVAGQERPNGSTILANAPMWNVFPNHRLCRGDVRYPHACTPDTQEAWETVFFQSTFTGPSRMDTYMNWGRSYEELLDKAIREGAFPPEVLVSTGRTLTQVLRS